VANRISDELDQVAAQAEEQEIEDVAALVGRHHGLSRRGEG
jgi:hypothetical protein